MKDTLTFDQLPEAVTKIQEKLDIIEQLLLQQQEQSPEQDEIMPVAKAAIFLDLAVPTVYSKVCRKELPVNKRGKRLYFYRSELMEWIKSGRKKTADEIREDALQHLTTNGKKAKVF
ncbi:Helix-turn-helix domain-containing protein [Mucilaginibacter mallensis]|uniref:Helix-turn-helix domain-containing protein n=1 Tax=Mucilaginibacter mallensis TaxID=652787 RepID=A0A1H2ACM0_MUCMA|nr:helix-turn-helix domain-containing protein [Mucilaginibacter mallensis]SDT43730.1 Helix-turn-helix domain-containing protein [Mucilaginibacter mallensis]